MLYDATKWVPVERQIEGRIESAKSNKDRYFQAQRFNRKMRATDASHGFAAHISDLLLINIHGPHQWKRGVTENLDDIVAQFPPVTHIVVTADFNREIQRNYTLLTGHALTRATDAKTGYNTSGTAGGSYKVQSDNVLCTGKLIRHETWNSSQRTILPKDESCNQSSDHSPVASQWSVAY